MKRIEILGIQGSGKSTILKLIKDSLIERGENVFDNNDLMAAYYKRKTPFLYSFYFQSTSKLLNYVFRNLFLLRSVHKRYQVQFIKNHQTFFCYILSEYRKVIDNAELRYRVFDQVMMTYGHYELAKETLEPSDFLLLDESIAYRPVSLFVTENNILNYKQIQKYFEMIAVPQIIVSIVPDISESIQRMNKRSFPQRIASHSDNLKYQYLENVKKSLEITLDYLKNKNIFICDIVNNNNFLKSGQTMKQINSFLDTICLANDIVD